jgi:Restriction alleviation protein Lar
MTDSPTALADELKPCPFCGAKAVDRREIDGFPMIYCDGDECFGPQTSAKTFQDALIQWNTRLPPQHPELDPADVWNHYCAETPAESRSLQGALAFGFDAAASLPAPQHPDVREMIEKLLDRNHRYLDSFAGRNELHCGPHMLNHALIESTELIERLAALSPPVLGQGTEKK